jgi:GNAT superfamily N-acetyltransferase
MSKTYQIVYEDKPEDSAWGIIGRGVGTYNNEQAGEEKFQRVCYVLKNPEGEIVGGILGEIYWDWFYIDLLWVKEPLRRRGYGRSLLKHAEERARQQGAGNVYLDTFSFQAPDFYKQNGYEVFGELPDFPAGHTRYFMTKKL